MPKVYEVECRRIAAKSMGPSPHDATIILTSEFQNIPPEEKGAVIAHELAHVGNRDCLLMPVFGTSIAVLEILAIAGGIERWFMGIILLLLVAVLWERELRADALGSRTCGAPLVLANALRRMKPNPFLSKLAAYLALSLVLFLPAIYPQNEGWLLILFIALWLAICLPTHPPTLYRVWRLREIGSTARNSTLIASTMATESLQRCWSPPSRRAPNDDTERLADEARSPELA